MSFEGRDDLDRALADGLRGLLPDADTDDADGALAAMRPRLRRARNRRRMVRASVTLGGFVVMGSAAFAFTGPSTHHASVSVASVPSTARGAVTATTSTTRVPTTKVAPSKRRSTTVTTLPERPAPRPTVPAVGPTSPTPSAPRGTTTTTVAPSELHTYHSDGGTVTVRFSGGRLTLVSYHAAPGYDAEVHRDDPDDVEVRFSGPDDRRIRVRVEEGHLSPEIR